MRGGRPAHAAAAQPGGGLRVGGKDASCDHSRRGLDDVRDGRRDRRGHRARTGPADVREDSLALSGKEVRMATEVIMPSLGFDMVEGVVARWLKKEGDPVEKGEGIVESETEKASDRGGG